MLSGFFTIHYVVFLVLLSSDLIVFVDFCLGSLIQFEISLQLHFSTLHVVSVAFFSVSTVAESFSYRVVCFYNKVSYGFIYDI